LKKFLIFFGSLLFFINNLFAQNDSISLFRESTGKKNDFAGEYKNAMSINIYQFVRGGVLLNYERILGNSGFALTAGVGFCKFDALGQFRISKFAFYYDDDNYYLSRESGEIRPIFDVALKYYFAKEMSGAYMCTNFTNIRNTTNIEFQENSNTQYNYLKKSPTALNYQSNELKLLLGFANDSRKQFYHDFNFGLGFRMIEYQQMSFRSIRSAIGSQQGLIEVDKVNKSNQTPWFFIGWRMGRRF
jgi:hypothetical protein